MKNSTIFAIVMAISTSFSLHAAPLTSIVGNWHLDEERGQRAFDSSFFAKQGQLGSTPALDSNDPSWTLRRFDTAALHFDGIDDYVRVPAAKNLEPRQLSVEAWVQATDPGVLKYIVAKSAISCHAAAYSLETENNGLTFFVAKGDGVTFAASPSVGSEIWDGKWHHVVGTFNEKVVRLFVDGIEVGTGTPAPFSIDYSLFPHQEMYIGDYDGDQECPQFDYNFPGNIDEVRVWRKALSPAEVAIRFQGD